MHVLICCIFIYLAHEIITDSKFSQLYACYIKYRHENATQENVILKYEELLSIEHGLKYKDITTVLLFTKMYMLCSIK